MCLDFLHWIQMGSPINHRQNEAESPEIELVREFLGLAIQILPDSVGGSIIQEEKKGPANIELTGHQFYPSFPVPLLLW